MSFDPYPPEAPYDYDPAAVVAAVRARVQLPAIFLLVAGILNLVAFPALVGFGFVYQSFPPGQVEKAMAQNNPEQWDELQRQGYTATSLLALIARILYSAGGMSAFTGLIVVLGAIRMMQLRSYTLAVVASVFSALPCVSPSCCLAMGGVAGVWALVVLLDADVRSAFL